MDSVNNRTATFKKILNVTSGNFLEQYDFWWCFKKYAETKQVEF